MSRPKDVQYALAFAEQIIGNDAPMAAPPDGFRAHDCAPALGAYRPQPRQACGERLRPGIVRIVSKAAHPPITVRGRFHVPRLPPMTAEIGDMFITLEIKSTSSRIAPQPVKPTE